MTTTSLAATLTDCAAGIPVDLLRDTATSLYARNIQRLITAMDHAPGRRAGNTGRS